MADTRIYSPTLGKAVSVDEFNNETLWRETYYGEARDKFSEIAKSRKFRREIATIYRCVDLRGGAVSQVPFSVYKISNGDEVVNSTNFWGDKNFHWLSVLPGLLYLTESSLLLSSEAFWLKEVGLTGKQLGFRWLASPYISPVYNEKLGIVGFTREIPGGAKEELLPQDVVYFMNRNPLGEIVPDMPQALSAAISAGVILNYEKFVDEFYKRGAVKATLLKVDRSVPPREKAKLRDFWQGLLSGVGNAYNTEVISGDVSAEVIGEGAGDSEKTEVLRDRRKDIATSMGVPFSLLFGDSSASYTAGPTEELNFLKYTIGQRINLIQESLNRQYFVNKGFRIRFFIEHLPAFKEFGATQVDIFKKYTDALLPTSLSARLAGIQLPDGVSYEDLDSFVAAERERQFKEKERIVTLNSKINEESGKQSKKKPEEDNNLKEFADDEFTKELSAFRKWLKNRGGIANIDEFNASHLTKEVMFAAYNNYWRERNENFVPGEL